MNESEPRSVETEERKQEHDAPRSMPQMPASSPDLRRDEQAVRPGESVHAPTESLVASSSELSFACVLIPRFSDQYLVGDIVDSLTDWMKQVCISYGWRLTMLSIRPGYMQWVMSVPLNANPARFMQLIRRFLSGKIFDDFPRFAQKNVSGEFWAPGNFVAPGNQLQAPDQVNEWIMQTRRLQGLL